MRGAILPWDQEKKSQTPKTKKNKRKHAAKWEEKLATNMRVCYTTVPFARCIRSEFFGVCVCNGHINIFLLLLNKLLLKYSFFFPFVFYKHFHMLCVRVLISVYVGVCNVAGVHKCSHMHAFNHFLQWHVRDLD